MTTVASTSRRLLTAVLLAALVTITVPSRAALNAYLTLTGETQGPIEGGATQPGREGAIEIWGWSHEVISPRDPATGLPTGRREHTPLLTIKEIDKSTPLLLAALVTNENIPTLTLRVYRSSRTGQEVHLYTVQLINARIVRIRQEQLDNRFPENQDVPPREEIAFVYERIVWTFEETGQTAEDSPQAQEPR